MVAATQTRLQRVVNRWRPPVYKPPLKQLKPSTLCLGDSLDIYADYPDGTSTPFARVTLESIERGPAVHSDLIRLTITDLVQ